MQTDRPTFVLALLLITVSTAYSFKMLNIPVESNNAIQTESDEGAEHTAGIMFDQGLNEDVTNVSEGQTVILECEATGKPAPTIHWLHDGTRILQGRPPSVFDEEPFFEQTAHNRGVARLRVGTTHSRLTLDCVSPADRGLYQCVANTPLTKISSATYLDVDSSRSVASSNGCGPSNHGLVSPTRIFMWEPHRLEFEGADVQLFCRASGFPHPHITWYDRNGAAISRHNPNFQLLKNGDLIIKNINFDTHMGVYRCHADNGNSEDDVTAFLYPTSP